MSERILPGPLIAGDRVGIVTVSAPEPHTDSEWFDRGVAALKAAGFDPLVALTARERFGYRAAREPEVLRDLYAFLEDPTVKAIICSGGGKNSNRLLSALDFDLIARHPKALIGVSDPSVLLNAVTAKTGLVTFHGPAVVWDWGSESVNEVTADHFTRMLRGDQSAGRLTGPAYQALRGGQAEGHLIAGCLSAVRNLLGTDMEPRWEGAILAWEDVGKPIEQLDAALTQFRDCGALDRIAGMVIGELVGCDDSGGWGLEEMVNDLLGGYSFPILNGLPFGHTSLKYTLPIGSQVRIDTAAVAPLEIVSSWVQD